MATPRTVIDDSTPFDAAHMNKFISGDGAKVEIKMLYADIVYSGGVLVVDSGVDSCGIVSGDLTYNVASDTLRVTVAGFVNKPHVQTSRKLGSTNFNVAGKAFSNTRVDVEFYDQADPGTKETPGGETSAMNFMLLIMGY